MERNRSRSHQTTECREEESFRYHARSHSHCSQTQNDPAWFRNPFLNHILIQNCWGFTQLFLALLIFDLLRIIRILLLILCLIIQHVHLSRIFIVFLFLSRSCFATDTSLEFDLLRGDFFFFLLFSDQTVYARISIRLFLFFLSFWSFSNFRRKRRLRRDQSLPFPKMISFVLLMCRCNFPQSIWSFDSWHVHETRSFSRLRFLSSPSLLPLLECMCVRTCVRVLMCAFELIFHDMILRTQRLYIKREERTACSLQMILDPS